MNKVQGFIVSLEKFDEIEISENYEEPLERTSKNSYSLLYFNRSCFFYR